ncbi:MAG: hypothetical protein ACO2OY_06470 [Thermodesulfobacteriaceae bacterium]|jgi:hypothetical protein
MRRQKYIINRKSGSSQPILISMLDVKEDNPIRKLDYIYPGEIIELDEEEKNNCEAIMADIILVPVKAEDVV